MLLDRVKKKKRKGSPNNGGAEDTEAVDYAAQVPDLTEFNQVMKNALATADKLESVLTQSLREKTHTRRGCTCG